MARKKIKIRRIENITTRQVTFSKRRGGLLKKAHDLSVLCDVEVGVIIFSSKGKLFQFASPSMQSILERYVKSCGDSESSDNNRSLELQNAEMDQVAQFMEKLKSLQTNLLGDELESLSLRDLIHMEQQVHESLGRIRARKDKLLLEQLEDFKHKVTETRKTTNANLTILEKLVDFCSDDVVGSGNFRSHVAAQVPVGSFAFRADTSEQSNPVSEGPTLAAKRSQITEDLNRSPAPNEDSE